MNLEDAMYDETQIGAVIRHFNRQCVKAAKECNSSLAQEYAEISGLLEQAVVRHHQETTNRKNENE